MDKDNTFRFRLDTDDDRLLRYLARRMGRTRSDTVRWVIRIAAFDALANEAMRRANGDGAAHGAARPGAGGGRERQ